MSAAAESREALLRIAEAEHAEAYGAWRGALARFRAAPAGSEGWRGAFAAEGEARRALERAHERVMDALGACARARALGSGCGRCGSAERLRRAAQAYREAWLRSLGTGRKDPATEAARRVLLSAARTEGDDR